MVKRGRNFWANWELQVCQPQQTTSRDWTIKNNKQRFQARQSQSYDDNFGQAFERERINLFYDLEGTGNLISSSKKIFVGKAKQLHCTCKSSRLQKASKQSKASNFFSCMSLKSNHMTFLVQFGIHLHSWVFQKVQIAYTRIFKLFEEHIHANMSQMNSQLYNYLYNSCWTA